ncbi:5'-nucleotidase C-terminal domain-containing protein [Idiomarina xiamenensis]|uniref:5'-nucleotidase C-terminal domain-containing protein n=1 Tax=Idiomarina xiamenensis TaxID=1207041 RepID=UPI0002F40BE1|nr:5'-nucleotidase C-terminal domain-containing protein [Idiomarina xiamenensis]
MGLIFRAAADGDRVSNIQVWDQDALAWAPMRARQRYSMVTNSFIASGQDGWQMLGKLKNTGRAENTGIDYAQSMIDYAQAEQTLLRPKQYSTQHYQSQ